MHAAAVVLLQCQDSKLHARGGAAVALLQWQDTKLLHRVKDEQTCNSNSNSNSNNNNNNNNNT
jgi:hypothetical protein